MYGYLSSSVCGKNNYYISFYWEVLNYNIDTMSATISLSAGIYWSTATSYPNRAYAIKGGSGSNYIRVNGTTLFTPNTGGSGTWDDPYYGYTRIGSYGADSTKNYSNWEGHPDAKTYAYATLLNGRQFTTSIDSNGYISFTIEANARLYSDSSSSTYNMNLPLTTVTASQQIDLYTKIPYKSGGSWGNGYLWYKDPSQGWIKKFLYRKENGSWQRK